VEPVVSRRLRDRRQVPLGEPPLGTPPQGGPPGRGKIDRETLGHAGGRAEENHWLATPVDGIVTRVASVRTSWTAPCSKTCSAPRSPPPIPAAPSFAICPTSRAVAPWWSAPARPPRRWPPPSSGSGTVRSPGSSSPV